MAEISAAAVKSLRERTGLPLMECKNALKESGGDEDTAIEWLRKQGLKTLEKRSGRETAFGRMGLYCGLDKPAGAMVELKCESAPVAQNEEFAQLAGDLAQVLASGPPVDTPEQLLDQPSPSKRSMTLRAQKDDLFNRIREVFNVGRIVRFDGTCGGYFHFSGTVAGVLLQVEGGTDPAAKDVCMHIAAMRPRALTVEQLDPQLVEKEREILTAAAQAEGKPDKIIQKIVDGRMRQFFAESVLTEQPFVKDEQITVGQYAAQHSMKLIRFAHWELGKE